MPVDWKKFASAYPAFTADPFFAGLVDCVPPGSHTERAAGLSLALLRDAAADARPELVGTYGARKPPESWGSRPTVSIQRCPWRRSGRFADGRAAQEPD